MCDPDFHVQVCQRKVCYRDKTMAKHAAKQVKNRGGPKLRPYCCQVCHKWHLLSIDKRTAKREARF